jgi:hypothetical protein
LLIFNADKLPLGKSDKNQEIALKGISFSFICMKIIPG